MENLQMVYLKLIQTFWLMTEVSQQGKACFICTNTTCYWFRWTRRNLVVRAILDRNFYHVVRATVRIHNLWCTSELSSSIPEQNTYQWGRVCSDHKWKQGVVLKLPVEIPWTFYGETGEFIGNKRWIEPWKLQIHEAPNTDLRQKHYGTCLMQEIVSLVIDLLRPMEVIVNSPMERTKFTCWFG